MTFEVTLKSNQSVIELVTYCRDNNLDMEVLDPETINVYVDDDEADELEDFFEKFNLTRRLI